MSDETKIFTKNDKNGDKCASGGQESGLKLIFERGVAILVRPWRFPGQPKKFVFFSIKVGTINSGTSLDSREQFKKTGKLEDINCRCLHGEVWEKVYLTPEQLKSIQEEQQRLEQKEEEVPPEEQSENTYQWGMICRDTGLRMDGRITARSPEEAERILRRDKYHMNTGITVFY